MAGRTPLPAGRPPTPAAAADQTRKHFAAFLADFVWPAAIYRLSVYIDADLG
jgi:hypothetical protein